MCMRVSATLSRPLLANLLQEGLDKYLQAVLAHDFLSRQCPSCC